MAERKGSPSPPAALPARQSSQTRSPASSASASPSEVIRSQPSSRPSPDDAPLSPLVNLDVVIVKQTKEFLELITGFETNNKYIVMNRSGEKIFAAFEQSSTCSRMCCGNIRPFDIRISNQFHQEALHLSRPLRYTCCCFCCFCCLQELEVSSPPGTVIGYVNQVWTFISPQYKVRNAAGDVIFLLKGPACVGCMCLMDIHFNILSADGQQVLGRITKKYSGFAQEVFTDADTFAVFFPPELDVNMKAVLLGACFLIDFMYFEGDHQNRNRDGMHHGIYHY